MIEITIGPEPAGRKVIETTGVAATPVPLRPRPATVSAASGMVPSAGLPPAPFAMDRPSPLAGQMWFVVAAMLLGAVMFVPGAVILAFFALSGFLVGGLSLLIDLTWQHQAGIFALVGVALVMLWVRLDPARRRDDGDSGPHDNSGLRINDRGPGSLVGRVFRLETPIEDGKGMLTFGGTSWRVAGKDCAAGRRVKVMRTEGTLLFVDPVECSSGRVL